MKCEYPAVPFRIPYDKFSFNRYNHRFHKDSSYWWSSNLRSHILCNDWPFLSILSEREIYSLQVSCSAIYWISSQTHRSRYIKTEVSVFPEKTIIRVWFEWRCSRFRLDWYIDTVFGILDWAANSNIYVIFSKIKCKGKPS